MCHGITFPKVKEKAETVIKYWFNVNDFKVNDDKFQYIVFCRTKSSVMNACEHEIARPESKSSVNLLGVYLHQKPGFHYRVDELCRKDGPNVVRIWTLT